MNLATLTRPAPHVFGGPTCLTCSCLPAHFLLTHGRELQGTGLSDCVFTVFDHLDRLFPPTHPGYRNWASKSYGDPVERMVQL